MMNRRISHLSTSIWFSSVTVTVASFSSGRPSSYSPVSSCAARVRVSVKEEFKYSPSLDLGRPSGSALCFFNRQIAPNRETDMGRLIKGVRTFQSRLMEK